MSIRPISDFRPDPGFETDEDFIDPASPRSDDRAKKTRRLILQLIGRWYWIALGLVLGVLASAYYLSKVPKK